MQGFKEKWLGQWQDAACPKERTGTQEHSKHLPGHLFLQHASVWPLGWKVSKSPRQHLPGTPSSLVREADSEGRGFMCPDGKMNSVAEKLMGDAILFESWRMSRRNALLGDFFQRYPHSATNVCHWLNALKPAKMSLLPFQPSAMGP